MSIATDAARPAQLHRSGMKVAGLVVACGLAVLALFVGFGRRSRTQLLIALALRGLNTID